MISLLYAGNSAVFDGLLIGALSAVRATSAPLGVYLLTMELTAQNPAFTPLTERHRSYLESIYRRANAESFVKLIDCGALYREQLLHSPNAATSYTPYTFLRLFADRIPHLPDKLLYLDTDTLICRDPAPLYETDITRYEFAAALDYYGRVFMGYHYCNAGVLLLNLPMIRKTGLFRATAALCAEKKLFLPDQTALNRLARAKRILPFRYNEQKHYYEGARDDTVIQHFAKTILWFPYFHTRNIKPWQTDVVRQTLTHKYDAILTEFEDCRRAFAALPQSQSDTERR